MVFGVGCQRERLFKLLCVAQTFVLAGTVCFYFQGSVEKTAPDRDIAGDTSQPTGETLRPVWGPMDKCYPGTTQRRRVESGKKEAAEAGTPKATGGLSGAAPKEEPGVRSQDAGEVRSPAEEDAASPIPAGKEVAEEEVAGTPGCEVRKPGAQLEQPGALGMGAHREGGWRAAAPEMTPDCHSPVRVGTARIQAWPAPSALRPHFPHCTTQNPSHRAPGPSPSPGNRVVPEETAGRPPEASEGQRKEDRPRGPPSP